MIIETNKHDLDLVSEIEMILLYQDEVEILIAKQVLQIEG